MGIGDSHYIKLLDNNHLSIMFGKVVSIYQRISDDELEKLRAEKIEREAAYSRAWDTAYSLIGKYVYVRDDAPTYREPGDISSHYGTFPSEYKAYIRNTTVDEDINIWCNVIIADIYRSYNLGWVSYKDIKH